MGIPWLVAGAGLSAAPPAQVPTWQRIKAETLQEASAVLKAQNAVWGNTFKIPQAISERASDLLEFPEEALEDLCLSYGVETTIRRLTAGSATWAPCIVKWDRMLPRSRSSSKHWSFAASSMAISMRRRALLGKPRTTL
jgi:hypothetical protein